MVPKSGKIESKHGKSRRWVEISDGSTALLPAGMSHRGWSNRTGRRLRKGCLVLEATNGFLKDAKQALTRSKPRSG
jgi:hypothetical protein